MITRTILVGGDATKTNNSSSSSHSSKVNNHCSKQVMTTTSNGQNAARTLAVLVVLLTTSSYSNAFVVRSGECGNAVRILEDGCTSSRKRTLVPLSLSPALVDRRPSSLAMSSSTTFDFHPSNNVLEAAGKWISSTASVALISAALLFSPLCAGAEDELAAKYGSKGFDSSLVDQTCFVDKCSLQAKACLADDPSCRKGLTCTAKCMGEQSCITGCFARYGNEHLDNFLKCSIEDNDCIKIAILPGGSDEFGTEPKPPAPTVKNFAMNTMEGTWFKVVGFNPNYDCYACQRNTFSPPAAAQRSVLGNTFGDKLQVEVEFSMPRMLSDGSPPPPKNERETVKVNKDNLMVGSTSVGFNDYFTRETMVFDAENTKTKLTNLVLGKGDNQQSYSRTAHSEGDMFGLKFWENWFVIGENDPGQEEFKFVYYNGKTRQNTYEGAFVYSRTKELDTEGMKKVYKIASDAGMNPDNFCKIRNGCFNDEASPSQKEGGPFRGILASTKVSQLLGVEPVAAQEGRMLRKEQNALRNKKAEENRAWHQNVGDYFEDPHKHYELMDSLRQTMEWPDEVKQPAQTLEETHQ
uniref:VDE lipocalin domain-containing protein n=1 Tax=Proboscia inermis TaxID=420281 RepID=A0A7S0CB35_9STRA|mmetsp:Transcript_3579/g.3646  ORF Transcript_3579/g.3646 Transcript_3579/m.3646 type:complete len:579 (+) Transcript_3579:28-1764(+)